MHRPNQQLLGTRAYFRTDTQPAMLTITGVRSQDGGQYTCRVDFRKSPTKYSKVNLTVTGKITNYCYHVLEKAQKAIILDRRRPKGKIE